MVFTKKVKKRGSNANQPANNNDKTTHLYNHDKFLTAIGKYGGSKNLKVLYLHKNLIEEIENLNGLPHLTALYLQRNKIKKIKNVDDLKNLRKLYLGYNEISVLENLERLVNLEEIYIEKQKLPSGDALCFEPRTVDALSSKLRILNVAHNNVNSIANLKFLKHLKVFNGSNNNISDMNDVRECVNSWRYLKEAWFEGNPIEKSNRYREDIIGSSIQLTFLDAKEIKETTRCFIKRFEHEKLMRSSKHAKNISQEIASLDLPRNYPPAVQKVAYNYLLQSQKIDKPIFKINAKIDDDDDNEQYIPWNSMPKSKSKVPIMIRKQQNTRNLHVPSFNSISTIFPNIFK